MKIGPTIVFILLFSTSIYASVGVATQKDNVDVVVGNTGVFQYEIQTIGMNTPQSCIFSFQEKPTLDISFDSNPIIVPPKSRTQVFGKVKIPQNAQIGSYTFNFCVLCTSLSDKDSQASSLSQNICNIPLKINILEKKQEEIPQKIKQERKIPNSLLFIAVVVVLIVIFLLIKEFKNKNLYR
mgnify:CR=1 FL=1